MKWPRPPLTGATGNRLSEIEHNDQQTNIRFPNRAGSDVTNRRRG